MTGTRRPSPTVDWFVVALVVAVLAELAVVVGIPVFVTVDGAEHMGTAAGLAAAMTGHPPAQSLLDLHLLPATNLVLLPYAALGSLIGFAAAEKVILATYVVVLPLASWYAVSGVRPEARWLSLVAIPLTFSFAFHYGLLSFALGIAGFLAVAGHAARSARAGGSTRRGTLVLGALLLATYMTHPVPFVQALVLLAATTLVSWATEPARSLRSLVRRSLPIAVAAAPALLLMLTLVGGGVAIAAETETRNPLVLLGATLSLVWGLVTYDLREAVLAAGLAATLAVVAIVTLRGRRPRLLAADGYLLFALLVLVELTVLAEGTTLGSGGGFVSQRLALFPVYGAVLWLAARGAGQRAMQLTAVVALVVASGFLVLRLPSYTRLSDLATAYVGVEACLARDATMVQANLWLVDPGPLVRTDPLTNEAGRVSAPTGGWDLGNLDASVALFPIRNRPGNDPYRWLRDTGRSMQEVPPAMDPERYAQVTGQTVDYVLVYGRANAAGGDLEHPRWLRLLAQLEGGYRLVATSSDGLLEAWELQADPVAGRGAAQRAAQPAGTCRPG